MHIPASEILTAVNRVQSTITFNLDGVILDANQNFLDLMGYRLEEVQGQHHSIFCEPGYVESEPYARLWLRLHSGEFVRDQFKRLTKQGREVWLQSSYNPVPGADGLPQYVIKFATDITATKEQSNKLESLARAINTGLTVIEFSLDGIVLYANQRMLDLVGYRAEELIGQHHRKLCFPEYADSEEYKLHWQRLRQGEYLQGEYLRIAKDGTRLWLNATYNPILDVNGRPVKITKFVTDVSETHRAQLALVESRQRAEAAAASKGAFLANMSHEIRTPMNAIIGFTDLLSQSIKEPADLKYVNTIKTASRSLLTLINDILDTAKLERGAIELEALDFSMHDLCRHIVDLQHILAYKKGISLELVYPPATPEMFVGDAFRIQQVLLNLLGNAIKFTDKGGVKLMVWHDGVFTRVAIQDTGIGIAANRVAGIFDSFTQADASMTRKYGGTGLGTTIARQLVDLMQGSIEVQSELGKGSTFTVVLPLPLGRPPALSNSTAPPPPPAARVNQTLHVLAVDDVDANLDLVEILLKREGHTVERAVDGASAVAAFRSGNFDLVLMDLQMPGMNGLEAAGAIRKFETEHGRRPTPIIALSANVMSAEKANAFAAGMDGYVSKPIDMRQLRNEIERVMHASNADSKVEIDLVGRSAQLLDIDSENGISVWGERSVYDQQLRRFVVDVRGYRKQLNDCLLAKDMVALKFLTHRIRGASGNLCLPRLSSVAAEVENNIDSMALDGGKRAGVALFSAIDSLDKAFEAYEATVPVSPAAEVQNKVDIGQVHSILDSLLPQLAAGRLNDKLLDQLYPMLPPRVAGAVRDDINAFKFIKACRTLTDHKTSLLSAS